MQALLGFLSTKLQRQLGLRSTRLCLPRLCITGDSTRHAESSTQIRSLSLGAEVRLQLALNGRAKRKQRRS